MRYTGPARVRLFGDPVQAKRYIGVARTIHGVLLNRLALGGVDSGSIMQTLTDGTVVRCVKMMHDHWFEIAATTTTTETISYPLHAIYMETGFLDARSSGVTGTFQDKNELYLTSEQTTRLGQDPSYADELRLQEAALVEDWELSSKIHGGKSHAIPAGYYGNTKRNLRLLMNPSKATGKLRLWCQALVGRADPEWEVPPEDAEEGTPGAQSELNTETRTLVTQLLTELPHTETLSSGLVTGVDYAYYFVSIDGAAITVHTTKFDGAGAAFRNFLLLSEQPDNNIILSEEEKHAIEAYMLSDLRLDQGGVVSSSVLAPVEGAALAHGWHFNRDGSKADIVTVEEVIAPGEEADATPQLLYNTARHYRLTVTELPSSYNPDNAISAENAPLTFSLAERESANFTPNIGLDVMWVPDYESYTRMVVHYWHGQEGYAEDLDGDAPVYCFYDKDDEFHLIRCSQTDDGAQKTTTGTGEWTDVYNYTYSCGGSSEGLHEEFDTHHTHGYYDTGTVDHKVSHGAGYHAWATVSRAPGSDVWTVVVPGTDNPKSYLNPIGQVLCGPEYPNWSSLPGAPLFSYTETLTSMVVNAEKQQGPLSKSGDSICVIPFVDAEAVYLGSRQGLTKFGSVVTSEWGRSGDHTVVFTGPDAALGSYAFSAAGLSSDTHATNGSLNPYEIESSAPGDRYTGDVSWTLIGRAGTEEPASISYDLTAPAGGAGAVVTALGRWSALFDPVVFGAAAYPYFDAPITVHQSTQSDKIYFADPNYTIYGEDLEHNIGAPIEDIQFSGMFSGWA